MAGTVYLTSMVKAGGCGSKVGPEQLREVLAGLPHIEKPEVLFGWGSGDDAGVYQLSPELAMVQTVDFFTPIVDDPADFGAVAAANAISDCYALGARPVSALAIVTFPREVDMNILKEILRGGFEKAKEAGVAILGGHSIVDPEPKYGLAVTGLVNPKKMVLNTGAKPGDKLVLTKKIGVGIVTSAIKKHRLATDPPPFDKPAQETLREVIESMKTLNKIASEKMVEIGVNACTDVTGFGLLGHARNIADASGVALRISYSRVPKFADIEGMAIQCTKGGGERNLAWVQKQITLEPPLGDIALAVLTDPQTSGPLLIAVDKGKCDAFLETLRSSGVSAASEIGEVVEGTPGTINVVP